MLGSVLSAGDNVELSGQRGMLTINTNQMNGQDDSRDWWQGATRERAVMGGLSAELIP